MIKQILYTRFMLVFSILTLFTTISINQEVLAGDKTQYKLLEPVGNIKVGAVKKFIAKDYFKIGDYNGVKISYIGDYIGENFEQKFSSKVEENVESATIKSSRLKKGSTDPFIISEIGPNYPTTLAHMWELLKLQGYGQLGFLAVDGSANVFYIPDVDGIIWAVHAYWGGYGWYIYASSLGHPHGWPAGYHVFGR